MAPPAIRVRGIRTPIPTGHILGRVSSGTGDTELISISDLAYQLQSSGAAAGGGGGGGAPVLPTIPSGDLLGNSTASSAAAADTTLTALIDRALGSVQGDILFRNSTVWTVLAPGTSNQVLKTQGAAANPAWAGLSALIDAVFGSAQGDILYRNASAWVVLTPGTVGQFLQTQGASANPVWANGGMLPLVTGDVTPGAGPFAIADDVGQFIGVPL